MNRVTAAVAVSTALLLLAACGGGGGDQPSTAPAPVETPPPADEAPAPPVVEPEPAPPAPPPVVEPEPEPAPEPVAGPVRLILTGTWTWTGEEEYYALGVDSRFSGEFEGTRPGYTIDDWGLWAKVGTRTLFRAAIRPDLSRLRRSPYELHVAGERSESNPLAGSAVWSGAVRAYSAHPETWGAPVSGEARIEADLAAATVDVTFSDFTRGHPDMAWRGLALVDGAFEWRGRFERLDGAFYGAGHQGVAGSFMRDRLDGVFGALREER